LATINISAALTANSQIAQKAQFSFPIKFPFGFNNVNLTNSMKESAAFISTSSIAGQLKSIIPIAANTSVVTNVLGTLTNKCAVTAPISGLVAISSISKIDFGLNAFNGIANLWTGGFYIYNNYGVPATLTQLSETYMGQPVYRLAMTVDDAHSSALANFQTSLFSHGVYGGSLSWVTNTCYVSSVYWRPVNKPDTVFGGTASNTSGWIAGTNTKQADGWTRYYRWRTGEGVATKSDVVHHSFYCPSLQLNETIYIDVCCPQTEQGITYPTQYVYGSRPSGGLSTATNINGNDNIRYSMSGASAITVTISGTDTLQSTCVSGLTSSLNITPTSSSSFGLIGRLVSSATIAVTIKSTNYLVPQTLTATAGINDVQTAIFKLITNIVANTSIAGSVKDTAGLDSDFISASNINGNLINLISADVGSESNIDLPQTFEFPVLFPFTINDKVKSNISLSSNFTSTAAVTNSSITNLLTCNIIGSTSINSNIKSNYSEVASTSVNTSITSSVSSKLDITGQLLNAALISCQIIEKNSLVSNLVSATNITGIIKNAIRSSSTFGSTVNIVNILANKTNLQAYLNSNSTITGSINERISLNSDLKSDLHISSESGVKYELTSNMISNSLIIASTPENVEYFEINLTQSSVFQIQNIINTTLENLVSTEIMQTNISEDEIMQNSETIEGILNCDKNVVVKVESAVEKAALVLTLSKVILFNEPIDFIGSSTFSNNEENQFISTLKVKSKF
jgi:hypothetical protein